MATEDSLYKSDPVSCFADSSLSQPIPCVCFRAQSSALSVLRDQLHTYPSGRASLARIFLLAAEESEILNVTIREM